MGNRQARSARPTQAQSKITVSDDSLQQAQTAYQSGRIAFERGDYRQSIAQLEQARDLTEATSRLGGEIQIWLVTAYEAIGARSQALTLCRQVSRHPHYETRKQGQRLLYILEAPRLKTRADWVTKIPDLTQLADGEGYGATATATTPTRPKPPAEKPAWIPEPPATNAPRENRFIWVALGLIGAIAGGLLWWH